MEDLVRDHCTEQDFEVFTNTESIDKLTAFEETIRDLEREEFQCKRQLKRRQERKNRERFTTLMKKMQLERTISLYASWAETVKTHLISDQAYLDLSEQHGTTPHDVFEDVIKSEKEILKQYKADFKKLVKTNGIRFAADVPFADFNEAMSKFEFFSKLDDPMAKTLLHEYYQFKIKEKESDKQKKALKALAEHYKQGLAKTAELTFDAANLQAPDYGLT